jgi:hypothetical protein
MSIETTSPFHAARTVSLNAGMSSAGIQLAGGGKSVLATNPTAALACVKVGGDSSIAASSADLPVPSTSHAVPPVNPLITYTAATLASDPGGILFTCDYGSAL